MIDDDFNENNKRVWLMLRAVTHKTDAWSIIKGFAKHRMEDRPTSLSPLISRAEVTLTGSRRMRGTY